MPALFQHRHYCEIARIIAALPADCYGVEQVAEYFADNLRGTNPNYDAQRFLAAAAMGQPSNGRDR